MHWPEVFVSWRSSNSFPCTCFVLSVHDSFVHSFVYTCILRGIKITLQMCVSVLVVMFSQKHNTAWPASVREMSFIFKLYWWKWTSKMHLHAQTWIQAACCLGARYAKVMELKVCAAQTNVYKLVFPNTPKFFLQLASAWKPDNTCSWHWRLT